jgi:hypothetical protein
MLKFQHTQPFGFYRKLTCLKRWRDGGWARLCSFEVELNLASKGAYARDGV